MELSCRALITLDVADATSEVGGSCERRGLGIYDVLGRKMTVEARKESEDGGYA